MSKGGYDYQFIDPGPTDDLKCPICHLVVRDAHQVICCGKLFCKSCLEEWLDNSEDCPCCHNDASDRYFQDTRADREVMDLKVYCRNKGSGCDWSGKLRSVEEHMKGCVYQNIECGDCNQSLLKLQLEKHLADDCPERNYICPSCSTKGTYRSITTEHQDTCPEKELVCQNTGCTTVVKRCKMPSHVEECPKEKVKCPFIYKGCGFVSKREHLIEHIEKGITQHVEMIRKDVLHPTSPIIIKIDKFSLRKKKEEEWFSNGFYTGPGGYRVRLKVYPNGNGDSKSTHVSVYINLMPGEYDDNLEFPMRGEFRVKLLNQISNNHHYDTTTVTFNNSKHSMKKREIDTEGLGWPQFISRWLLIESKSIQYLANDVMYLKVTVEIHSTTKPWLVETVLN